ncbi:MAG: iron-containing alcohol dehydrogenase, partial [Candidatus Thorarchaeota archaeon]
MWFFFSPNIIYGPDAIDWIENISGNKCFIVTDKVIEDLGYLKKLTDVLDKYGKEYEVFNEVMPDPREEGVLKARELCMQYQPEIIFALGGGSVMDTAKTLWALYEFPEFQLDDIHAFRSDLYEMGKKAKLVAIPTTSGTGAETTYVTVISRYEQEIWKKYLYLHRGLIPTYAIVDPIFPKGMPPKLTADTGFDALAHSIEGLGTIWRNEFSNALALKAIELIFKYLPIACKDGNNEEARDYMHQAATIAGLAFGNGNVHIGHTMGHSWGAFYHVPHGRSVGILLKYVTQFILNDPESDEAIKIYAKLSKQLG